MVIYIAGFIPLFRGKRSNHFRLQRQSKHGALCRLKGQAAAPFPDKSSSRFTASVFIGKTLYPTAPYKRAFENRNATILQLNLTIQNMQSSFDATVADLKATIANLEALLQERDGSLSNAQKCQTAHRRKPSGISSRTAGQRKSRANDPAFFMSRIRHPGDAYDSFKRGE